MTGVSSDPLTAQMEAARAVTYSPIRSRLPAVRPHSQIRELQEGQDKEAQLAALIEQSNQRAAIKAKQYFQEFVGVTS